MLLRISLIVAILAAIAAGVISFVSVKDKIDKLVVDRNDWNKKYKDTDLALNKTKKELDTTKKDLESTKTELATTKDDLGKAQTEVASLTKKSADLTDKLANATKERDDARASLAAYEATGFKPEQIVNFGNQVKQLQADFAGQQQENKLLSKKLQKTQEELARYQDPGWKPPVLPAGLKGRVLVIDPKWNFVVLDVGEDQGVKQYGEMLVSRNGKLVAKVSVRSVEPNRCVANILPDWKLGEVVEGDAVISVQPPS
jgi:uncharacterized phage infection (PIP) family protein YhgE